jgi:hypothetical protein
VKIEGRGDKRKREKEKRIKKRLECTTNLKFTISKLIKILYFEAYVGGIK